MEEHKFVQFKKNELGIKDYIRRNLGKGAISKVSVEYTPVGEKIVITTTKPGIIIGRGGEKIQELTRILKKNFSLENPHIEISEITKPEFDSQSIADEIAMSLERLGSLKFKVIAYKMLQRVIRAGALGVEIRMSGKLPSDRARTWRFTYGYLKKTGDTAKIVDKAQAVAETQAGVIGIVVSILSPEKKIHDQIIIDDKLMDEIKRNIIEYKSKEDEEAGKKMKKKKGAE